MNKTKFISFTASLVLATTFTLSCDSKEKFTDSRDGKKYKTVTIDTKIWMAENLNFAAEGSKCYDNNPDNCAKYGRLYDWETAKKSCPDGWHLPSNDEYNVLYNTVGGDDVAGKKLRARSGWNENNGKPGNGTDDFGFSALPGGYGISGGNFYNVGDFGYWWIASENVSGIAYYRSMNDNNGYADWSYYDKSFLFSVRCVQTAEEFEK